MLDSIRHIGMALKAARLKSQLSQRALSAKTGVPQSHISKIENGTINLQISSLIQLSRALNLELMLVPRTLIPTFEALLHGSLQNLKEQIPKYRLDEEEINDE